jgi:flagellar assembly protein FliH
VRPKNVRFVDVSSEAQRPAWLRARVDESALVGAEYRISPLIAPEVPSHARPALSPLLESVRPPPMGRTPSQFPGPLARSPSQFPGPLSRPSSQYPASIDPGLSDPALLSAMRPRDTMVEQLVPRAEEEAVTGISAAIAEFVADRARSLADAEQELVELVKTICHRVVLREISLGTSVIEALIHEGLMALGQGDRATVKLGPFFADTRHDISENLQHKGIDCVVVIDPTVGAYGCHISTELGRVDESVETRLNVLLSGLDDVHSAEAP